MVEKRNDREKFNKIVKGEIKNFGIPDPFDMFRAYFPCEFVEVIDEEKMIMEVYEPSIKKYHIVNVNYLEVEEWD